MKSFHSSLSDGFRSKIKREAVTTKTPKDANKVGELYNTEIIFSRVLYLNSTNKIKINDIFSYELAPIRRHLFRDTGEGRYSTSKVDLRNALKVEVSARNIIPETTLTDRCAMMHSILHRPKVGKVSDLLIALRSYNTKILFQSDVYLVFDKYKDCSIKLDTRQERLSQFRRLYNLSFSSPLPAKETTMRVTDTK